MARLVAWIGRCRNCKACVRLAANTITSKRTGAMYSFTMSTVGRTFCSFEPRGFAATCFCGSTATFSAIYGEVTHKGCGSACRNAKGGSCECACGGDNHGISHAA